MIVLGILLAFMIVRMISEAIMLTVTWECWRDHVKFKRRSPIGHPMSFFEFNEWLQGKS